MHSKASGFTFLELILTAAISAVVILGLIKIALLFMFELKRQQQQMEVIANADLLSQQIRLALQQSKCAPVVTSKASFKLCEVSYYFAKGKIYRKEKNKRAENMAENIKNFHVQRAASTLKIDLTFESLTFAIVSKK